MAGLLLSHKHQKLPNNQCGSGINTRDHDLIARPSEFLPFPCLASPSITPSSPLNCVQFARFQHHLGHYLLTRSVLRLSLLLCDLDLSGEEAYHAALLLSKIPSLLRLLHDKPAPRA
jgi:hypothetical protein